MKSVYIIIVFLFLAIVFIALFVLQTIAVGSFIVWAYKFTGEEDDKEYECALNFCAGDEAYKYIGGVCECYTDNVATKNTYID